MSMFVLPENWVWARIGDLCLPVEDVDFRVRSSLNFQYIDISSIDREEKSIILTDKVDNKDAPSRARQVVLKNDVLVSTVRPGLNAVAIVPDNLDNEICSTGFCVLRADTSILNVEYLFAWVRSSIFIQCLTRVERGIGYPAVSNSDVENTQIPLPPLSEQRRISTILREADEIRKMRRQANEKVKQVISAIFNDMFEINSRKNRFATVKLSDVSSIQYGLTVNSRRENLQERAPYLRVANVFRGKIDVTDLATIGVTKNDLERYALTNGDVLVVEGHADPNQIGRAAAWQDEVPGCLHQNHLLRIRSNVNQISPYYLMSYLNSQSGMSYMLKYAKTSSGLNTINSQVLSDMPIVYPPLDLQKDFERCYLEHQSQQLLHQLTTARIDTLFQSLLSQAFTGELTASWRKSHTTELAQEARKRDELLRAVHATAPIVEAPPPLQQQVIEERTELAEELTTLQRSLLALIDRSPERYFPATGLHEEITAHLDEEGRHLPELDEQDLYRSFAGLDCSLDTIRRDLHYLAALGLLKDPTLRIEDEEGSPLRFITGYRSLLADDDSYKQDLAVLEEIERESMEEASA